MDNLLSGKKNILGILCLVLIAAILFFGLWPFNFRPENKVEWLKDENGVRFYGRGIIYSEKEFPILPSLHYSNAPTKSFTIEFWIQPDRETFPYLPHILSFSDTQKNENFFIGQWKSHLILGKGIHGRKTYREIGIKDVLKKGEKRFVTITIGGDATRIYVDGILLKTSPTFRFFSMNEKPSGNIILGNSPTGESYWTGNLFGLAIYNQELSEEKVFQHFQSWMDRKGFIPSPEEGLLALYLFDERSGEHIHDSVNHHHLLMPSRFQVLQKRILIPPWKDFQFNRSYLMDILTNILGFIPFGFFLSAYLWMRKKATIYRLFLISILFGGCISLAIELIQVYLPTRNSQLMDVITNMIGTALGAVLFHFYHHKKKFNSPNLPTFHSSISS
jgi:VanZ family protein